MPLQSLSSLSSIPKKLYQRSTHVVDGVLAHIPTPLKMLPLDIADRIKHEALGDGYDSIQNMFAKLVVKAQENDTLTMPDEHKVAALVAFHVYDDPFSRPRHLGKYILIEEHNSIEYCVYHDAEKKKIILGYRGTEATEAKDYISDVNIILGTQEFNQRFQESLDLYDTIITTYPEEIITITGHSLGGTICYMIAQRKNPDATVVFNPGSSLNPTFLLMFKDTQFGAGWTKKVFTYRILGDIVSTLSFIGYVRTFRKASVNPAQLHGIANFIDQARQNG